MGQGSSGDWGKGIVYKQKDEYALILVLDESRETLCPDNTAHTLG